MSFALDDEEDDTEASTPRVTDEDEEPPSKRNKLKKNPNVDTSFLPDRDREEAERADRERLRLEWLSKQTELKNEDIEVTYSFWDGSGHRKTVTCKKGDTISGFLEKCRAQFAELRGVGVDNLMYVKEDLIIPHVRLSICAVDRLANRAIALYVLRFHNQQSPWQIWSLVQL